MLRLPDGGRPGVHALGGAGIRAAIGCEAKHLSPCDRGGNAGVAEEGSGGLLDEEKVVNWPAPLTLPKDEALLPDAPSTSIGTATPIVKRSGQLVGRTGRLGER